MKKYRTGSWNEYIEVIEIERETKSSIWIKGERYQKMTNWHKHFDTWIQALHYLLMEQEQIINKAETRINTAKAKICEINNIEKPC